MFQSSMTLCAPACATQPPELLKKHSFIQLMITLPRGSGASFFQISVVCHEQSLLIALNPCRACWESNGHAQVPWGKPISVFFQIFTFHSSISVLSSVLSALHPSDQFSYGVKAGKVLVSTYSITNFYFLISPPLCLTDSDTKSKAFRRLFDMCGKAGFKTRFSFQLI